MEMKTSFPLLVVRWFGNATPLKTVHWACDGSCRVVVERPTPTDTSVCSGVNSSRLQLREGREELNSPAGAVRPQDGEASGLDPEVLHYLAGFVVCDEHGVRGRLDERLVAFFECC
jgi:hypothetical protein